MKLSICIPTYNRAKYLVKNINIIICQINKLNLKNSIEICISDNASTDSTEEDVNLLISTFIDNKISYRRSDINLGPDWNYIYAMKMAKGEYSILWGDDDFFKEQALITIFELIDKYPSVSLFLTNRSCIDGNGNYLFEQIFVNESVESLLIDFCNENEVKLYFLAAQDIACLFSFISSIIYKTSILYEREFDESYIGSQYAFTYYWWTHLLNGNKLFYKKVSYIDCTINVSQAWGNGVSRVLVDYNGYIFIANKLELDKILKNAFLSVINQSHKITTLYYLLINERKLFLDKLYPLLIESGMSSRELDSLVMFTTKSSLCKNLIKRIFPPFLLTIVKSKNK